MPDEISPLGSTPGLSRRDFFRVIRVAVKAAAATGIQTKVSAAGKALQVVEDLATAGDVVQPKDFNSPVARELLAKDWRDHLIEALSENSDEFKFALKGFDKSKLPSFEQVGDASKLKKKHLGVLYSRLGLGQKGGVQSFIRDFARLSFNFQKGGILQWIYTQSAVEAEVLHTLTGQWTAKDEKIPSNQEAFDSYLRDLKYRAEKRTHSKAERKVGVLLNEIMGPWKVLKPPVKPLMVTVRQLRDLRTSVVEMAADALKAITTESQRLATFDGEERELADRLGRSGQRSPVKKPAGEKSRVQSPFDILDLSIIADELDPIARRAHGEHLRHRHFARKRREYV